MIVCSVPQKSWGPDKAGQSAVISEHATAEDAFREIARLSSEWCGQEPPFEFCQAPLPAVGHDAERVAAGEHRDDDLPLPRRKASNPKTRLRTLRASAIDGLLAARATLPEVQVMRLIHRSAVAADRPGRAPFGHRLTEELLQRGPANQAYVAVLT